jgi:serine protease Do
MSYAGLIEKLRRSTVQVLSGRGGGSGVVWDGGSVVVTNAHVAAGRYAEIVDAGGQCRKARIVRRDRERDLALLVVETRDLEPAEIGDSGRLRSGQIVVAVGHPLGMPGVVAGVIHAAAPASKWVEADLRLAPGNSGGMLADTSGRVIGINTMIFRGIGLAIPSNRVSEFVREEFRGARAA